MNSKSLLFIGIVLLTLGILIRKMTSFEAVGLSLILLGVICKTVYIVAKIKNGLYKPGYEVLFLGGGLLFFLSGVFFRNYDGDSIYPVFLIILGLTLKVMFIIRFIKKIKASKEY